MAKGLFFLRLKYHSASGGSNLPPRAWLLWMFRWTIESAQRGLLLFLYPLTGGFLIHCQAILTNLQRLILSQGQSLNQFDEFDNGAAYDLLDVLQIEFWLPIWWVRLRLVMKACTWYLSIPKTRIFEGFSVFDWISFELRIDWLRAGCLFLYSGRFLTSDSLLH